MEMTTVIRENGSRSRRNSLGADVLWVAVQLSFNELLEPSPERSWQSTHVSWKHPMVSLPRHDCPVAPIINIVFIISAFAVIAWV